MRRLVGVAFVLLAIVLWMAAHAVFTATEEPPVWLNILGGIGFWGGWLVSLVLGLAFAVRPTSMTRPPCCRGELKRSVPDVITLTFQRLACHYSSAQPKDGPLSGLSHHNAHMRFLQRCRGPAQ
jgi:hypothetical protein